MMGELIAWISANWQFLVLINFMFGTAFSVLLKLNLLTVRLEEIQEELRKGRDGKRRKADERVE